MVALFIFQASAQETHSNQALKSPKELILAGQRKEAIEALYRQKVKPAEQKKVRQEAERYSTLFLTEQGQKAFELGESMSESNPELALTKFDEALTTEGENIQILRAIGQIYLKQQNCRAAEKLADRGLAIHSKSAIARILKLEALDCQASGEALSEQLKLVASDEELKSQVVVQIFLARDQIKKGSLEAGLKSLRELTQQKSVFPEAWYWRWKLDPEQGQLQARFAEEYVKACNNMSPRLKRESLKKGSLCLNIEIAKAAIAESVESDEPKSN